MFCLAWRNVNWGVTHRWVSVMFLESCHTSLSHSSCAISGLCLCVKERNSFLSVLCVFGFVTNGWRDREPLRVDSWTMGFKIALKKRKEKGWDLSGPFFKLLRTTVSMVMWANAWVASTPWRPQQLTMHDCTSQKLSHLEKEGQWTRFQTTLGPPSLGTE